MIFEEYQAAQFEMHNQMATEANSFLLFEVKRLAAKLQASKQALQDYREQTKAVSLEESKNITDARLRELNAKVTEAKGMRLRLEADYAQVKALSGKKPELLLNLASVASAPAVIDQKKNVTAQEAELANLSQRYKWKHPKYIQAQSRLEELRAGLARAIKVAAEDLGSSVESALATEEKFEEALRQQEGKSLELGRLAMEYETLARVVKTDTALYESVLTRLDETDVTKNILPETLRLVTPSTTPPVPAKPRVKLDLALALLAGGVAGAIVALARIAMDRTLHTVDQAERFLDLPVLGSVPRDPARIMTEADLPVVREPTAPPRKISAPCALRSSLLAPAIERTDFVFTSALPGEGKSFCAANYAIALAQQGLRHSLDRCRYAAPGA